MTERPILFSAPMMQAILSGMLIYPWFLVSGIRQMESRRDLKNGTGSVQLKRQKITRRIRKNSGGKYRPYWAPVKPISKSQLSLVVPLRISGK